MKRADEKSLLDTWLIIAFVVGLIARLWLVYCFHDVPVSIVDAQDYERLAIGLAESGDYLTEDGKLSSLRPPLYPYLVSLVYRAFGPDSNHVIRILQSVLGIVTAIAVLRIGTLTYSRNVGLLAAILTMLYPSLIGFSALILSETLFTTLVILSVWSLCEAVNDRSHWWFALTGLLLGLGALTRSVLWLFTPILGCAICFLYQAPRARRLVACTGLVLTFIAVIAPWAYRNQGIQETFSPIDVMGGRNAMMGNYEHTPLERSWATVSTVVGEKSWFAVLRKDNPDVVNMTQGQIDKAAMKYGLKYAFANPLLTAQRSLVRFFNYWQIERTLVAGAAKGIWGDISKFKLLTCAVLICGGYVLAIYLAIYGLWMFFPERREFGLLLLLYIVFPCAIHSAIFAHSRYHLPTMPLMLIFTSAALLRWPEWKTHFRNRRFWAAFTCATILTIGWIREIVFVDLANASLFS